MNKEELLCSTTIFLRCKKISENLAKENHDLFLKLT